MKNLKIISLTFLLGFRVALAKNLSGDVAGYHKITRITAVGGQPVNKIAKATVAVNNATSDGVANALVKLDSNGNFVANMLTVQGTVTNDTNVATKAYVDSQISVLTNTLEDASSLLTTDNNTNTVTNFTGNLLGDVTGTQTSTVVNYVGGQTAVRVAQAIATVNLATNAQTPNTLIIRDENGDFSSNTITANLNGNANSANNAINFTGDLLGDVTGTQQGTVVSLIGGKTASAVATATTVVQGATSLDIAGSLVRRDGAGGFAASTVITNEIMADSDQLINFTVNGTNQMTVNQKNIILNGLVCNNSVQVLAPNNGDTIVATASILLLTPSANLDTVTICFPPNPFNGQLFKIILGASHPILSLLNITSDGSVIINQINSLSTAPGCTALNYYFYAGVWYRI